MSEGNIGGSYSVNASNADLKAGQVEACVVLNLASPLPRIDVQQATK